MRFQAKLVVLLVCEFISFSEELESHFICFLCTRSVDAMRAIALRRTRNGWERKAFFHAECERSAREWETQNGIENAASPLNRGVMILVFCWNQNQNCSHDGNVVQESISDPEPWHPYRCCESVFFWNQNRDNKKKDVVPILEWIPALES